MGAILFGKHTLCIGLLVYNTKQIHSTVTNIAEHIHAFKIAEFFGNGCKSLRIDFCAYDFNAVYAQRIRLAKYYRLE